MTLILHGSPNHGADELGIVLLRGRAGPYTHPIAKHGHDVGDAPNLVEAMGDEDDAHTLRLERLDLRKEMVDFVGSQRGRRLVEGDDLRIADERPGKLHELLLSD